MKTSKTKALRPALASATSDPMAGVRRAAARPVAAPSLDDDMAAALAAKFAPASSPSQDGANQATPKGDFPMNFPTLSPKISDLLIKAATTAAGIASASTKQGDDATTVIGKAIAATLQHPSVNDAAAAASTAVDTMPAGKPWYQSLTVNASIAGIIASVAGVIGLHMTGADVQSVVAEGSAIATSVAAIIAIVGRIRTKQPIGTPAA